MSEKTENHKRESTASGQNSQNWIRLNVGGVRRDIYVLSQCK